MWRFLGAWVLIGAIVQLAGHIWLRARLGGRAAEVAATNVAWWAYPIAVVIWPIDLVWRLLPFSVLIRIPTLKAILEKTCDNIDVDAKTRCPDCGKPWLEHEDHGS